MYMKNIAIASVLMVVLFCTSCRNSTNMTPNAKTESLDSLQNGQSDGSGSIVAKKSGITAEMAYKGVNNYCHKEYDWSACKWVMRRTRSIRWCSAAIPALSCISMLTRQRARQGWLTLFLLLTLRRRAARLTCLST